MKRGIALILFLGLLPMLFGCQRRSTSSEELFLRLLNALEMEERCVLYTAKEERAKQADALELVYGREDALQVLSAVSGYAIALSKKAGGGELHMMKVRHQSEEERVKGLLRGRMEALQQADMKQYLGEEYENCIGRARIYQKGAYLFLLVTQDNDRAILSIDEIF